ncbi:50S ribosomal protein L19e [Haloglomus irregulare]|jgi:large subunit ribosomal protein L19e|uniref:Large ribosomal subunit protein eL19 n=1 Tax=Haloglomus irregulare TaxID=2234134 RepID=A0A554NF40_9EURY|nr:50S ribosomal protein L19e [Haloglomus irregulare]TSD15968.1 50S ribosomal protein L19e [Haloglomus irregulare]
MTDLKAQKRLAADVLDVGKNRVKLDPEQQGEIADAITRDDVRELIDEGAIRVEPKGGNSRGRARERAEKRSYGHQKGQGTRKGTAGGRNDETAEWRSKIRAQRRRLRTYRQNGELDPTDYRQVYRMAGGGEFDSVADVERYVRENYDVGGDD